MTDAYPLAWPLNKPRALHPERSRFQTAHGDAVAFLLEEIRRMGGKHPVISTNIPLRKDGLPYANYKTPDDRGAAVYFLLDGKQMCFACDRWDVVHDNIHAIAKTIEALRGISRWGSGEMVQQAYDGFVALPAPPKWWEVLGVSQNASIQEVNTAYRNKAKLLHPDHGGSEIAMAELNRAKADALENIGEQ